MEKIVQDFQIAVGGGREGGDENVRDITMMKELFEEGLRTVVLQY